MANKFPLIIDPSTNRIVELPATDNLDLSGSDISSVDNITSTANITANYFIGNGSQLTGITSTNANYANFAGNITIASQPNITSVGTLTSLDVNGNIVGVNITANTGVFTGNGSGLTNIAGANVTGTVANATYATSAGSATTATSATTAGTVTTNAQPNITSVGNLTNLVVTGNLDPTNVNFVKFDEAVVNGGNTGAATLTPNAAAGTIYQYNLTGNITLSTLSNAVAGTSMTIILTQDNVGNRLLTSTMKFAGNSKTLSTAANTTDIMCVFYDGTTYYASLTKGYV